MITENDVIQTVSAHLKSKGYDILQQLSTVERGIDLVAEKGGTKLLVEAKGGTSSKNGTARYGLPFTQSQVRDHVAQAFLACARMRTSNPDSTVAMALPKNPHHLKQIIAAKAGFQALEVKIFLVDESLTVEELT